MVGDRLKVAVKSPPVDGKANAAVLSLLARHFGVKKHDVEILIGKTGKRKRVRIRIIGAAREILGALIP